MALMPVADALAAILAGAEPLPEEMVALDAAHHRVLARDLAALRTQPPQAMSAMDGYAVRAADAAQAGARLKVIGEVAAGRPFDKSGRPGRSGPDLYRRRDPRRRRRRRDPGRHRGRGRSASPSRKPRSPGRHIRPAGVDFQQGRRAARRRKPPHRPRSVAGRQHELSGTRRAAPAEGRGARHRRRTGDAGIAAPAPARSSIPTAMRCGRWPAPKAPRPSISASPPIRSRPPPPASAAPATAAPTSSITTGGASVGDHDLVKQSLEAEGVAMAFWRIAMRPGKPMMHGRLGAMRVIGLPGNPVSSYVCALPVSGAVDSRTCRAARASITRARRALLGRDVAANDQREDYLRARLEERDDGALIATPVNHQDSSLLGESRCGTGTCDTSAVRARGQRRLGLRHPAAAALSACEQLARRKLIAFT